METRMIRASMKTTWAAYVVALLLIGVGIWTYLTYGHDQPRWLALLPLAVLVVPLSMHVKRRLMTLRLEDHHLTLERGFLSRTRRTLDMAKIQDVTVKQTLGQRMIGVGDLILEDSGQSGFYYCRIETVPDHDPPQRTAGGCRKAPGYGRIRTVCLIRTRLDGLFSYVKQDLNLFKKRIFGRFPRIPRL